jgi:hypothetical protein
MSRAFTCFVCGEEYETANSDEAAAAFYETTHHKPYRAEDAVPLCEPCMRETLRRVAQMTQDEQDEFYGRRNVN